MSASSSLKPLTVTSPAGDKIHVPDGLFIGGSWKTPKLGADRRLPVYNPATGKELCQIAIGSAEDVDEAVQLAETALRTNWGLKSTPQQRSEVMYKVSRESAASRRHAGCNAHRNGF